MTMSATQIDVRNNSWEFFSRTYKRQSQSERSKRYTSVDCLNPSSGQRIDQGGLSLWLLREELDQGAGGGKAAVACLNKEEVGGTHKVR